MSTSPLEVSPRQFTPSPTGAVVQPRAPQTAGDFVWVLDPMSRKLRVPRQYIQETQALFAPGSPVPSLCMLYLKGQCRHMWCRQAHINPAIIQQLRQQAMQTPTCCAHHGDPHTTSVLEDPKWIPASCTVYLCGAKVSRDRIGLTLGMRRLLEINAIAGGSPRDFEIPAKAICRLHAQQRCRYLEDCNNVHICRAILHQRGLDALTTTSALQNLQQIGAPGAASTVVIGDVMYSVEPITAIPQSLIEANRRLEVEVDGGAYEPDDPRAAAGGWCPMVSMGE